MKIAIRLLCFATFLGTFPGFGEVKFLEWNWSKVQEISEIESQGWVIDVHYDLKNQAGIDSRFVREPGTRSVRLQIDSQMPIPEAYSQSGQNFKIKDGSHFRAEIRTSPWHEKLPMGTEYWLGWSYFVPATYVHDKANRMTVFQAHMGKVGPPVEVYIDNESQDLILFTHHQAYSNSKTKRRVNTGLRFTPGEWMDFVVHIVWDTESGGRGLTEIWVNEKKSSIAGGNVFEFDPDDPNLPYPGTPKLGMYKWPWRYTTGVNESKIAGVTRLELLVGPVRFWRSTAGEKLTEGGYAKVAPRGGRK